MKSSRGVRVCLSLVALVFALVPAAFASGSQDAPFTAACGAGSVSYRVHLNDNPPPNAQAGAGKTLVYFIHDSGGAPGLAYPTTRMAVDGKWVGANRGDSYFSVEVEPGEHHLCASLQTSIFDQRVELAHFTAEAGKTYYYRTRLVLSRSVEMLELEPVDSDQGRYLAGTFSLSEFKTKK